MRTLSQKLEGAKRYVKHPDYKVGLEMLDEFIEDAKKLEEQVKNLTLHGVVGRSEQLVCDNHSPDLEHFMKYSESICKNCKQKV